MDSQQEITSRSNAVIKEIRQLRQRKARQKSGLFIVEGIHHVGEAVEAGWEIDTMVYSPELLESDFATRLIKDQSKKGIRCIAIPSTLFEEIAEKENPQGIIAILHQQVEYLSKSSFPNLHLGVAVVSPQDPGNVGTILRTIDAVGADGLFLLDGGVDPFHPSSIRASMGTIFWKKIVQGGFDDFTAWVRARGYTLVGSSAHAREDYRSLKICDAPAILLLGSEQKGLTQDQLAACDVTVSIPMQGRSSSLNLAVAAGVLLFVLVSQSGKKIWC